MEIDRQENGALIIRAYKGVPFYEAKWRDATKKQRKRRLGKAWLKQDSKGRWIKRRGRVPDGYLDQRRAYQEMSRIVAEVEAEQQIGPRMREARFEDAVEVWLEHLEFEKRAKPSTLAGNRSLLAKLETGDKRRRGGRIMRALAGRTLVSISTQDIQRFLAKIDREPISPRTVNIHRQVLHSIFEHARRADTFALRQNPVAGTQASRRRCAPDRDLRARGAANDRRCRSIRSPPEAIWLRPLRLFRRNRAGAPASQPPGRSALHLRWMHGPAYG